MATISERLRAGWDERRGNVTFENAPTERELEAADTIDALVAALERSERHLVSLYRGVAPHGNYNDYAIGNRFADSDEEVKAIREALARAKG